MARTCTLSGNCSPTAELLLPAQREVQPTRSSFDGNAMIDTPGYYDYSSLTFRSVY